MYQAPMYNDSEIESDGNVTECLYGWDYDLSIVSSSIVIDVIISSKHGFSV